MFRTSLKFILPLFLALAACNSYDIKPNLTAQERFALAMKMFNNKDYLEAKNQFKIIILNNPALPFVDNVQYHLAESHFQLKEYILASDEYARLIRLYPQSEWVDDAQFKIAMSDYRLSPKATLDQKYTKLAVDNFQRFLEDFPKSELVPQAEKLLKECRTKLAKKEFKAGELYRKLHDCEAALVYFNSVLENYYDTQYAKDALYWKGECLYKLDRKDDSFSAFTEMMQKYPKTKYTSDVRKRLKVLRSDLSGIRQSNGMAPTDNQTKN